ncbi:MAG: response regulator, partial [Candidatus Marinimicrobia bacterium]|nr:response regulator [Candidatus Neomarinimicrobiota bacterium]
MKKLKILILEDNKLDAKLIKEELTEKKFDFTSELVETEKDFNAAIHNFKPNIILSDYTLPHFTGFEALEIAKKLIPDIPFIFVTGTLSEEVAVDLIKKGVWDYVFKENLLRLIPAIENALKLKEEKDKKKQAEEELKASNQQLQASEQQLKVSNQQLLERVKELNCLYKISQLVETPDISYDEFFQGVVDLIPISMQYPEITFCRMLINSKEYKTRNFKKTEWKHNRDIFVDNEKAGSIAIYQLKKMPDSNEELFLKEERSLLNAIAERLGHNIERKQAEEALQESETKYKELFNNTNNGIAVYEVKDYGKDFIFKDFNKAAERIDKCKREDLIGRSIFEMRPGVEKFGLIDSFRKVLKTGEPAHHPVMFYEDNKLKGWYENFIYELPSGEIVTVFKEITERKQAEEELKKHRDHLEELVKERTEELEEVHEQLIRKERLAVLGQLSGGV